MKAVTQWADVTTCHGIRDVLKSSSLLGKISWSLLVIVFMIIMALQLHDTERTFAQHRWVTTVFEESSSGIHEFPIVTVCSYNRLSRSAVSKYNLSEADLIYLLQKMPPEKLLSGGAYLNDSMREAQAESYIQWRQEHNMTIREIFREMSPRCDDMFEFVGISNFQVHNCTPSENINITPVFAAEFGQCYQVSIRLPFNISYPGKKFALSILLNAHLKDYLNFSVANYVDQGFALQFQYGPKVIESQWMSIAPGYHFMIGLRQRQNRVKLSSMHSFGSNILEMLSSQPLLSTKPPCELEPKLKYQSSDYYTREHCLVECMVQPFVEYCGCITFIESPYFPMCEPEEFANCLDFLKQLNDTEKNGNDEECTKSCAEPCFDRRIETTVSFTGFPPEVQLESFRKLLRFGKPQMSLDEVREDYAPIDIYFEKISVTVVEMYEAYTLEDFVSSFGGVMSLWAGMSILTVVQAVVYFLLALASAIGLIKKEVINKAPIKEETVKKEDAHAQPTNKKIQEMKPFPIANCDHPSVIDVAEPKLTRLIRFQSSSDA